MRLRKGGAMAPELQDTLLALSVIIPLGYAVWLRLKSRPAEPKWAGGYAPVPDGYRPAGAQIPGFLD